MSAIPYVGIDIGCKLTRVASNYSNSERENGYVNVLNCDKIKRQLRTIFSIRKNQPLIGNQVTSTCDAMNTICFVKRLIGEQKVNPDWKKEFGMQCSIVQRYNEKGPNIEIGYTFNNTAKEYFTAEYIIKRIIDYCIEILKAVYSKERIECIALSIPSYWTEFQINEYQGMIASDQNQKFELVRDHLAIAYCYYYSVGLNNNTNNSSQQICFINVSHSYSFAMMCSFSQNHGEIERLVISRDVAGFVSDKEFEDYFFEEVQKEDESIQRDNCLKKPKAALQMVDFLHKNKCDAFLDDIDEFVVDGSKISGVQFDSVFLEQSTLIERCQKKMTKPLETMINDCIDNCGHKVSNALFCICGGAVRIGFIKNLVSTIAKGHESKMVETLSVDDSVAQGLVYYLKSTHDSNSEYHIKDCDECTIIKDDNKMIMQLSIPEISEDLKAFYRQDHEHETEILKKYETIFNEREEACREYNREYSEVLKLKETMPTYYQQLIEDDLNRYFSVTSTDSNKHFYLSSHYKMYTRSLKQFKKDLQTWKENNYAGCINFVPLTINK